MKVTHTYWNEITLNNQHLVENSTSVTMTMQTNVDTTLKSEDLTVSSNITVQGHSHDHGVPLAISVKATGHGLTVTARKGMVKHVANRETGATALENGDALTTESTRGVEASRGATHGRSHVKRVLCERCSRHDVDPHDHAVHPIAHGLTHPITRGAIHQCATALGLQCDRAHLQGLRVHVHGP